jgi:Carboxypeptidase regulatory-like domain
VVAAVGGAPIADASVFLRGGTHTSGAVTGPSGAFTIRVPRGRVRLVAARIGFHPDTIVVGDADSVAALRLREAPLRLTPTVVQAEQSLSASTPTTAPTWRSPWTAPQSTW